MTFAGICTHTYKVYGVCVVEEWTDLDGRMSRGWMPGWVGVSGI